MKKILSLFLCIFYTVGSQFVTKAYLSTPKQTTEQNFCMAKKDKAFGKHYNCRKGKQCIYQEISLEAKHTKQLYKSNIPLHKQTPAKLIGKQKEQDKSINEIRPPPDRYQDTKKGTEEYLGVIKILI